MWSVLWRRGHALFFHDRCGVGAVEFAFVAPVVIMVILGTAEVGQYALRNQSLGATAARLGDLITREEALSRDELQDLISSVDYMTAIPDFDEHGRVIVSAVTADGNARRVSWQQGGGGVLDASSSIGQEGGSAEVPSNVSLDDGETLIAVELFYDYEGLFSGMYENLFGSGVTPAGIIRKIAWFRGRKSDLAHL